MPFPTDQVLFLLVLVDFRHSYFPLHRYHSVSFPSFLHGECCNPSSSSSLHSRQWLDSSEHESWAFEPSSFFSAPTEGCNFGKIVRHLYEQKREVALNTFEFSIYRIFRSGGVDTTKDLSENLSHLSIQITVSFVMRGQIPHVLHEQDSRTTNTACTNNPAYVQTILNSGILILIMHCGAVDYQSSYEHASLYLAPRSLIIVCKYCGE